MLRQQIAIEKTTIIETRVYSKFFTSGKEITKYKI